MFTRTTVDFLFIMAASLALLGVLRALKIDGQLAVIKNDCYERLAIGQRHNSKDIYKTSHVTTVLECQLFCTEEKETCKSFSFGIGVKGNASCELSRNSIKETADLKPIGTKTDTDYDLYIKKLGCTLVIDKNNPAFDHYNKPPSGEQPSGSYDKPQGGYDPPPPYKPPSPPSYEKPQGGYEPPPYKPPSPPSYEKPQGGGYEPPPYKPPSPPSYEKPQSGGYQYEKPSSSGYPSPNKPSDGYGALSNRPSYGRPQEEIQHVQTLVSVSTGPQKPVLDPYHEILVSGGPYSYARPPFRPSALNHPYDKPQGPKPDEYGLRPQRPDYGRPNPDRYDSRPGESNMVSYGQRPIPDKYGSYIPRPDHYNDYYRPDDYYRPNSDRYRPRPPPDEYNSKPRPPNDGYSSRPRPPPDEYNPRPRPPTDEYNPRPRPPTDEYNSRPRPPSNEYNSRPRPPTDEYNSRPRPPTDEYNSRPRPPTDEYNSRPRPPTDEYNSRPRPPTDEYNSRPRPPTDEYNSRPRPPTDEYNSRPRPPTDEYNSRPRPPTDEYNSRPRPPVDEYNPRPRPPVDEYNPKPRPPSNEYNPRPRPPPDDYNARPPSRPNPNDYEKPNSPNIDYIERPHRPDRPLDYDRPNPSNNYGSKPPSGYDKPQSSRPNPPSRPNDYDSRPNPTSDYKRPPSDDYRVSKPGNDYLFHSDIDRYDRRPEAPSKPSQGYPKPDSGKPPDSTKPGGGYDNSIKGSSKPKDPHSKLIVTQSIGPHGESITSIITELDEACFRRVLAGKRVARALVKRALFCERVEDCQRECAEEKRFACEGFNYRLDPTGRGKGECELLEIPLSHLDIGRDLYPDTEYDYYERDRNAASANCKRQSYYPGNGYGGYYDRRQDQRPYDWWEEDRRYGGNRRPRPDYGYDVRPPYGDDGYRPGGNRRGDFAYHDSHHSEHSHNYHYEHYDHGPPPYDYHIYEPYLPPNRRPYDDDRDFHKYYNTDRDRDYWGINKPSWGGYGGSYGTNYNPRDFDRKNYYLPPPEGGNKNWGQYGGSYGQGGVNLQYNGYGHSQSFDFWGLNKYEEKFHNYGELPPNKPPSGGSYLPDIPPRPPSSGGSGGSYLPDVPPRPPSSGGSGGYLPGPPPKPPSSGGSYLPELPPRPPSGGSYAPDIPPRPPSGGSYLPEPALKPPFASGGGSYLPERPQRPPAHAGSYLPLPGKPNPDDIYSNAILPAEPRYPYYYDFLKDECSLRSAAGFRLTKGIVKKFISVPNIYECELLCFKEKEFPCASYAYRYSSGPLNGPIENCYLSNRNYKELDFYTDLEPDRNFDVYTMNNMKKCEQPRIRGKDNSECFWRVRSAQRLDHKVVRDSLSVKSIVECQIECLRSVRFTCRAFSFRYGSPVIGGPVDNCLLTDWPYYEMDPRIHFVPEPGFEIYERGSFGHGCEPHHFGVRGKPWKNPGMRIDQLCYAGLGSPAGLLRQATKKALQVATEEECKAECSKLRENTLFQCVSLSYNTRSPKWEPNCKLSDILQRDLLPNVDYVPDPDSWLFAWDIYNPECRAVANEPVHNHIGRPDDRYDNDIYNAIGTWRVYSVSGWPCRRGTLCKENRVAGFWYCELEGGDANTWDYCCRPDHQCGFSDGFPYQWCYVGPGRTQWRKCSDRYYPYIHNLIDRFDRPPPRPGPSRWPPSGNNYLPEHRPPPYRPGNRPDRPPAPPTPPPPRPSLDEYEMQFEAQFLDPPKPGGFGQPRHWPLSYLHKEMPPNSTDSDYRLMKASNGEANPKFAAIQNLIDIIKSNDLKNVQYQITNESNKADDILFVKIPLPTNFTEETRKSEKIVSNGTQPMSDPIDLKSDARNNTKRSQKSLPIDDRFVPVYRRSYITRTNVTNHRSRNSRTL
ncbi:uncharacterized protein LOC135134174 isoform X1 [Zophobas morio]|uniref:uncharacterized protein LOC135134174 isoform X1 n=1 Tax=Zophobas morio TaxID=2755281 RepID=UPI00308286A7